MKVRLVALPPPRISRVIGMLARKVAGQFPHWFAVGRGTRIPHITLFVLQIPPTRLNVLKQKVRDELKERRSFSARIPHYQLRFGAGWTGLTVVSASLSRLRRDLFRHVKHLDRSAKRLDRYFPHFTLTKFKNARHAKTATKGAVIPLKTLRINRVAICLDDRHGQITRVLGTFTLK
jgi:hypothetical protein